MISRRQFLVGLGATGAALSVPLLHGQILRTSHTRIPLWNDGAPPLRLAHLSDLHYSRYTSLRHIGQAVHLAIQAQPDLICLTGDFVDDIAPDPALYCETLRPLAQAAPTFACLGNHDGGAWLTRIKGRPLPPDPVIELLKEAGIHVLRDHTEDLPLNHRHLLLTGVHDLWSKPIDPARARLLPSAHRRIVLAHNPDTKDLLAKQPWDLMLSGHTHGGQLRLPVVGGRLTAPVQDDRFIEGLHPWRNRHLYITRGVGALYGVRINCPPEVSVLDLI
ncbi:MAG TPA: phosphodiesterase YaeI [Kiritimatiellia bacterium]|nr:phosphodiesterase YaeI [Kiritimatiellia bacterium]